MERFDEKFYETPCVELIKPKQTKYLHGLEGYINPTPFQKTIDGNEKLYDTFPRARSPLHDELSS